VAEALGLALGEVASDGRMHRLRNWDSLAQVSIFLALEERTGLAIADDRFFKMLTSVQGIAEYLRLVQAERVSPDGS
jgi:acyl carrier protein